MKSTIGKIHQILLQPRTSQLSLFSTLAVIDPRASSTNKNTKKSSKHRKQRGGQYKFVDRAKLKVNGGSGGKGCISYESKLGSFKKRPDGGHGGRGGNVVLVADKAEQSLNLQAHHFKAEDGKNGSSQQMHGRNGKDKVIRVPCGVIIKRVLEYNEYWDEENQVVRVYGEKHDEEYSNFDIEEEFSFENVSLGVGENESIINSQSLPKDYDEVVNREVKSEEDGMYHWESNSQTIYDFDEDENDVLISSTDMLQDGEREKIVVADLDKPGSYIVIANGGKGGIGNCSLAKRQHIPELVAKSGERAQGKSGDIMHLELELKLIADIGLVGYPNAGKSSLLAAMSKAQPEIAPYPFTTLHPLVGMLEYRDGFRAVLADVPGIVDGASIGRGRGFDFLRHLERTKALIYIVDAAGVDGRDPLHDLTTLACEIQSYGGGDMHQRPALVVANKLDLIPDLDVQDEMLLEISKVALNCGINFDGEVHGISAGVTGEGLGSLSKSIRSIVEAGEDLQVSKNEEAFYNFKF